MNSMQPIKVLADYFAGDGNPIIEQEFVAGRGWRTTGFRKRASRAWLIKIRREGVEVVALRSGGRLADFRVAELLTSGVSA